MNERIGKMVFGESAAAVIGAVIIGFFTDVIHQQADIVIIDNVIMNDGLSSDDFIIVAFEEFIRESFPVKRFAMIHRVIENRDVFGFVAAFGMSGYGDLASMQMIPAVNLTVPGKRPQLMRRIAQIGAVEIIPPLRAARA